jgi:hypothetical protein
VAVGRRRGGGWLTALWYEVHELKGWGATWVAIGVGETAKPHGVAVVAHASRALVTRDGIFCQKFDWVFLGLWV